MSWVFVKLEPFVLMFVFPDLSWLFCISKLFYYFNFLLVVKWSGLGQELQNSTICMCSIAGLPSLLKTSQGFRHFLGFGVTVA